MSIIAGKLDRKLPRLFEALDNDPTSGVSADWKNPDSPDYDRQYAEDALYHTIGPLTDNPTWFIKKDKEGNPRPIETREHWTSPSDPPPGWRPGGPAPKWTQKEVITAMAGDPSVPDTASDDPRSPAYGNKGGSPLYRWAKQTARHADRANDMAFREDLYGNGLIQLMTMMQPGYDESRSPFIAYVHRDVVSAMQHGVGAPASAKRAISKNVIHRPEKRDPKTKRLIRPALPDLYGMGALMKLDDPETVRLAASVVKGKYREERSHDKNLNNPFGPFSSAYYKIAMDYANALESGDEYELQEVRYAVEQFTEEVQDAIYQTRGASTGLGQAISTPDRARSEHSQKLTIQSMDKPTGEDDDTSAAGQIVGDTNWNSIIDPEGVELIFSIALTHDLGSILKNSKRYQKFAQDVFYGEVDRRYDEAMREYEKNQEEIRRFPEAVQRRLEDIEAQKKEITKRNEEIENAKERKQQYLDDDNVRAAKKVIIPAEIKPLKPLTKPPKALPKPKAKAARVEGKAKIGGPMTVNELRHMARMLGPLGSNYPGRGTPRANTQIPRDARGWCIQDKNTQEDPEIEPLPNGGLWHSIWSRTGYKSMASSPSAIAEEFTKEVLEFNQRGIPSARAEKVAKDGEAMGKVAVNAVCQSARIKFMVVLDAHRSDLGLDESISRQHPLLESVARMTPIDRRIVVETCEWIIGKIEAFQRLLAKEYVEELVAGGKVVQEQALVEQHDAMQPVDTLVDALMHRRTLVEARGLQPAIITMHRGTVIVADHVRKIRTAIGREIYVVGIEPGQFPVIKKAINKTTSALRDFYGPITWHPNPTYIRQGVQDANGWCQPDENGRYCANRVAKCIRKFKQILTMNPRSIEDIRLLQLGEDVNTYRYLENRGHDAPENPD